MTEHDTPSHAGQDAPDSAREQSHAGHRRLKVPRLSHSGILSLIVLAVVVLAFGVYYFVFAEKREEYLTARELRQLSVMRDNTGKILTGFATAANNWIDKISDSSRIRVFFDAVDTIRTRESYPGSGTARNRRKNIHLGAVNNQLWLTYRDTIGTSSGSLIKEFRKKVLIPLPADQDALNDLFDVVLLVDSAGGTLFEYDVAGLSVSVVGLDSLLGAHGEPYPIQIAAFRTGVSTVVLAQTRFKAFSQPLAIPPSIRAENAPWLLLGLIRADRFKAQSLKLPYDALILFVFLILVAILSWPFVKVGFMSASEQLRPAEVVLMGLAGLLGSALVTALFADFFCIQVSLTGEMNSQLRAFAGSVQSHFRGELDSALVQLRTFASVADSLTAKQDTIRTGILGDTLHGSFPSSYPFVSSMYLVDSTGAQKAKWTVQERTTPFIPLRGRKYFRDIREGRMYQTRLGPRDTMNFTIEPHLSLTTGEFETSIATPFRTRAGTMAVACLTTGPSSLYEPTVTHDYAFCIIDGDGTVLYHSDISRNLSENFFRECDEDGDLVAAVHTRTNCLAKVTYWGESCVLFATPVRDLPWFIVVIEKQTSLKAANLETLTVTMAFFLIHALLILVTIVLLSLPRAWQADWVWPVERQKDNYLRLMFFYLLVCFVSLMLRTMDASADHLTIVTSALPVLAIVITFIALRKRRRTFVNPGMTRALQVVLLATALLAVLTAFRPGTWFPWLICAGSFAVGLLVIQSSRLTEFLRREWLRCLVVWAALYIVATLLPLEILPAWRPGRGLLLLATGLVVISAGWRVTARWRDRERSNLRTIYALAATAFLWLAAVQPALNFFKVACDAQMELLVKHNQLHLAEAIDDRRDRIESRFADIPTRPGFLERCIQDSLDVYCGFFFNTQITAGPSESGAVSRGFIDSIAMPALMPHYDEVSTHVRAMLPTSSADALWRWSGGWDDVPLAFHSYSLESRDKSREETSLSTTLPGYLREIKMLPLSAWALLVLTMFGLLALLYYLVQYMIGHVFMIDAIDTSFTGAPSQILEMRNHAIMVLGASKSDKAECLVEGRTLLVDFNAQREPDKWKLQAQRAPGKILVIDHLETLLQDPSIRTHGLLFLEDLVFTQHRKTLLFSTTEPPTAIHHAHTSRQKGLDSVPRAEKERWAILLDAFYRTRFAGGRKTADFVRRLDAKFIDIEGHLGKARALRMLKELIRDECGEDPNLQSLALLVLDELTDEQLKGRCGDEFLRTLLEFARPYYHQAWKICSRDQHRVLIHLARNGYVNAKNRTVIEQLFRVGLVRRTPALAPMNRTFRSFILEVRQPSDTLLTPEEARRSTWRKLGLPITIVGFGVAVFLLTTQRDVMDSTTAFLTGAAGLLPAILKLLGLFRPDDSGSAADS